MGLTPIGPMGYKSRTMDRSGGIRPQGPNLFFLRRMAPEPSAVGRPTKVSILIPFQKENDYLAESLAAITKLTYPAVEVVLAPDVALSPEFWQAHLADLKVPVLELVTGPVSPSIKRDSSAEQATGEILAFLDDDAYPEPDWLDRLVPHFADPRVCAVGGPQITPPSDGFWGQVSGATFLSPLNGAAARRYHRFEQVFQVDDWPSVNLLVRKADFLAVGGFDSAFWPGEDTKLCADLVATGKTILCDGQAPVFHHRRAGFYRHMRQVGNYGEHRGYFAKVYPSTSRKPAYFAPSAFLLFVLFGWLALFLPSPWPQLFGLGWALYAGALGVHVFGVWQKSRNLLVSVSTLPFMVGVHLVYGFRFLKGLLAGKDFASKLGR